MNDLNGVSRRDVLRLGSVASIAGLGAAAGGVALLGASSTAVAQTPDDLTTPVGRLKNCLRNNRPLAPTYDPLEVAQGLQNSAETSFGADAVIYPTPRGFFANPNPVSLAEMPQIWGHRRDTWRRNTAGYIGGPVPQNASWFVPVTKVHKGATLINSIPVGLHFIFTGRTFDVLFAGTYAQVTLIADSKYMAYRYIANATSGAVLSGSNTFVKFDFGVRATRRITLYGASTQGVAAIAIGPQDEIQPWDRSTEPSFIAMTDSYGAARSYNWPLGGPFWEAAAQLGIPHLDLNAMGGTGYAANHANADTRNAGNAFRARIPDSASASPDLFLTAGGINDNNSLALYPYGSAAAAQAGFVNAVSAYYRDLRAALPNSVLAAIGPWAPRETNPRDASTQSKLATIRSALQAVSGPWIFIDNLNGGWINSSGASAAPTGRGWQTGTGKMGAPRGDGNGDIYVAADGTHPSQAGCGYLGEMLANNLRAGILAL